MTLRCTNQCLLRDGVLFVMDNLASLQSSDRVSPPVAEATFHYTVLEDDGEHQC